MMRYMQKWACWQRLTPQRVEMEKTGRAPAQSCFTPAEVESRSAKCFMAAQLNGKYVMMSLDIRSQCVALRKTDADDMALAYQGIIVPFQIRGYASGWTASVGRTRAQLKFGAATATVDVLIVPDDGQRFLCSLVSHLRRRHTSGLSEGGTRCKALRSIPSSRTKMELSKSCKSLLYSRDASAFWRRKQSSCHKTTLSL